MTRQPKQELIQIGRRIQKCREDLGLSQMQVVIKLNDAGIEIGQGGYSCWELGKSDFKLTSLIKLADILGVDPNYLTGQTREDVWADEEAARYFNGLPPSRALMARNLLKSLFEESDREETTHGRKAE